MQLFAARQAFNGCDLLLRNRAHLGDARPLRLSVDQDRAGAALALPATIFASGQVKVLSQHTKQAGLRIAINRIRLSIYCETNGSHSHSPDRGVRVALRAEVLLKIIYPPILSVKALVRLNCKTARL